MLATLVGSPAASLAQPTTALPGFELDLVLPMPSEVTPDRVVLWSAGQLVIEHDAIITGGGRSALVSMPATPPSTKLELRVSAKSQAEHIYSAHDVVLDRSQISGDVHGARTVTLLGNAQVLGTIGSNAALGTAEGAMVHVAFPDGTNLAHVTVASNATRTLAPGRYLNVSVGPGAMLRLTAGSYFLEQLKTAPDSALVIDDSGGAVRLFVRKSLEHRGRQQGGSAQTFLVVGLEKPVIVDRDFTGALVAPGVAVQLGNQPGAVFTGSFFGRTLTVREHSTVRHVASPLVWRPQIPFGTGIDATRTCDAPFLTLDPSEVDLLYVANPPCPPAFCDFNEQPIATPDDSSNPGGLNSTTDGSVTCSAIVDAGVSCVIDPTTATTTCETASDCDDTIGEVCGERCADLLCTSVELRCGQLAASCNNVASGGLCDARVWRECADPEDLGTVSLASVQGQMFVQEDPQPGAYAEEGDKPTPAPTYPPLANFDACDIKRNFAPKLENRETSTRDVDQGSSEWGLSFQPTFDHFAELTVGDFGGGLFKVGANVGLDVDATVRGQAVSPLSLGGNVTATRCGVTVTLATTLFGFDIDIPELVDFAQNGLAQGAQPNTVATPSNLSDGCEDKATKKQGRAQAAKMAAIIARQVKQFVEQFGTTRDLCTRAEEQLGVELGLCTDPTIQNATRVADEYRAVFDEAIIRLSTADTEQRQAQAQILIDDSVELLDEGDEFDEVIVYASIGIGPLSLTVQVRAVGSYSLSGRMNYRIATEGDWVPPETSGIVVTLPSPGNIRASAGAQLSAHLDVSLIAFVGAGIPEFASAGVEGKLELLDGTVDFNAVGSMLQVSEPDPRVLTSDWAGDLIPDITIKTNTNFRWVTGWQYFAHAILSMLDGSLDLVARVGVDPFQATFREKLTDWKGVSWEATLVDADPLEARDNLGATNEQVPLTRVPAIGPISPDPADFIRTYTTSLLKATDDQAFSEACVLLP